MALTLIGSDDFTETTNTNVESHTPSGTSALASNWVHLTWQLTASAVVDATEDSVTQPYHSGTGNWNPYVIGPTAAAIQAAECTGFFGGNPKAIIVLAANDTTYWRGYLCYFDSGLNYYRLYRIDNGTPTLIASFFDNATKSTTDVVRLRVDASGVLTVSKNGADQGNYTDTTYTSGKPGLAVKKSFTSAGILDFSAYQDSGTPTASTVTYRKVASNAASAKAASGSVSALRNSASTAAASKSVTASVTALARWIAQSAASASASATASTVVRRTLLAAGIASKSATGVSTAQRQPVSTTNASKLVTSGVATLAVLTAQSAALVGNIASVIARRTLTAIGVASKATTGTAAGRLALRGGIQTGTPEYTVPTERIRVIQKQERIRVILGRSRTRKVM